MLGFPLSEKIFVFETVILVKVTFQNDYCIKKTTYDFYLPSKSTLLHTDSMLFFFLDHDTEGETVLLLLI